MSRQSMDNIIDVGRIITRKIRACKCVSCTLYMNGMVAKVSDNDKPLPGCEIVVSAKSVTKPSTTERLAVGSWIASIAAMIATIANALN